MEGQQSGRGGRESSKWFVVAGGGVEGGVCVGLVWVAKLARRSVRCCVSAGAVLRFVPMMSRIANMHSMMLVLVRGSRRRREMRYE